mmetsp:Transcript_17062/g.39840  ORF Transcript_17062/g.39840 Transcript_17062/m.39840 type:complete len:427 (-) Transcript_17062:119-1399(-)
MMMMSLLHARGRESTQKAFGQSLSTSVSELIAAEARSRRRCSGSVLWPLRPWRSPRALLRLFCLLIGIFAAARCCLEGGVSDGQHHSSAFVPAPSYNRKHRQHAADGHHSGAAILFHEPKEVAEKPVSREALAAVVATAATALSAGKIKQASRRGRSVRSARRVDWLGTETGWNGLKKGSLSELDWLNEHGVLTISCLTLFAAQVIRLLLHQPPTAIEVVLTTLVYMPWMYFCWRDTDKLENHYQVTFYASCGWGFFSLTSLHSMMLQDKYPDIAFGVLSFGMVVFTAACLYFYGYHWARMWRHFQQNRFRPLWIPGLTGLMALHGLSFFDYWKRLDDPGWWKVVCTIYSDEWWWVSDVRIIELFVTAAALWLIILHIKGVFTGMKNAAVVVLFTIAAPFVLMLLESTWIRASSWQHYFMLGPKYW